MVFGKGRRSISIVRLLVVWLLIFVSVLTLMLVFCISYFINRAEDNARNQALNTLSIYAANVSGRLNSVAQTVDELSNELLQMEGVVSEDEMERYFAEIATRDLLNSKMVWGSKADVLFARERGDGRLLSALDDSISGIDRLFVNSYLKETVFDNSWAGQMKWDTASVNGRLYFIRHRTTRDFEYGAMVADRSLTEFLTSIRTDGANCLFFDEEGRCIYAAGEPAESYLDSITNGSPEGSSLRLAQMELTGSSLTIATVYKSALEPFLFSPLQWVILLVILLSLVMGSWIYSFTKSQMVIPLHELVEATVLAEQGDLDHQVTAETEASEVRSLQGSFNHMVRQIKQLKIESYEEKLRRQKTELRYLQMQIRPHFYLNALTTIHSLAGRGKTEQAQEYIEALSGYLRYSLRSQLSAVRVEEELGQLEGYLKMQSIRFPDSVFLSTDADLQAKQFSIPQFLLLTMMENALKHAMTLDGILFVSFQIRVENAGTDRCCRILYEDNGPGFPESILQEAEDGTLEEHGEGEHIGLQNMMKTLQLMYGDKAEMLLRNAVPNGAQIEITIREEQTER